MFLKFIFLITLFVSTLFAHRTGLSYVNINENDITNKISIIYKKPIGDTKSDNISFRFPRQCVKTLEEKQRVYRGFIINSYHLWCGEEGLLNTRIWVDGLVSNDRGILIRYKKGDIVSKSLLRATTPFIYIDHKSDRLELFIEYIQLGVVHILKGFDHLLFIFSLILLATNIKKLFFAITAFTLSHSITLVSGILGFVSVAIPYVEAMIALSIVFLARELIVNNRESFSRQHLGVVTFIFGLLHGFGFSSVLATIGLPQDEIPLSLFAFNIGIEIGQILFIIVMGTALFILKNYLINYKKRDRDIAYIIGAISSYWLIERVSNFLSSSIT